VKNDAYSTEAIAALLQARCERLADIPEKLDFFDVLPDYGPELFVHKKSRSDEASSRTCSPPSFPPWRPAGLGRRGILGV
jgi:glutamyl-tRNA synthetase